jgi:2-polyprenyl-6-methoxyphenol hydroxylase-like FAD-dependent oxidoreductase
MFDDGSISQPFNIIVDGLGTRSPLAPATGRELPYGALWASLEWPQNSAFSETMLEQRYRRASTMAGVLPIGRGQAAFFWSLRADRLSAWHKAGLDAWKSEVLALWPACAPLLEQITAPGQLTFARYAHRTLPAPVEPHLIHLGDAWHSASPQLGQGANMALLDAWALGLGLAHATSVDEGLTHAVGLRRRHVRIYQALTALFTPVYQSDSRLIPWLRDRLVGPLSRIWPATWIQAAMVAGLIGNPLRPLELDTP